MMSPSISPFSTLIALGPCLDFYVHSNRTFWELSALANFGVGNLKWKTYPSKSGVTSVAHLIVLALDA